MKIKSQKGFTVIDIAVAIAVLFIFVSLIAILSYNFNSSSNEIKLKSEATELAIEEIEKIKNKSFSNLTSELTGEGIKYSNSEQTAESQEIKEGFYRKVIIEDYHDINPEKKQDIVKRIRVQIKYKFKTKENTIELATLAY